MSRRHEYQQIHGYGTVSNANGQLELVTAAQIGSGHYLYIETMYISVYEPANGGGGIFRLQHTDGTEIHYMNVDGAKDLPFNFGEHGWRCPTAGEGIQMIVYGAQSEQASVSVMLKGHIDNR